MLLKALITPQVVLEKLATQLLSTIRLTRTITHLSKTLVSTQSTTKHTRSLLLVKEVLGIMQKM